MINFFVVSIFPEIIECYTKFGILSKAIKQGFVSVHTVNPRNFYEKVDDTAYGGFPGMVLKPEPIVAAYEHVLSITSQKPFVIKPEPWGKTINQHILNNLKNKKNIIILCGRYEGMDKRIDNIVDLDISIGDFILSSGELVALSIIDGITRLLEGVLSDKESLEQDSFSNKWLGYPVYTRPEEFKGHKIPWVLKTGNHKLIELWSLWERIELTVKLRPDLIPKKITNIEKLFLEAIKTNLSFEEILGWNKKLV
jgi:tRNA (guanine37-N1)-methyltransferase